MANRFSIKLGSFIFCIAYEYRIKDQYTHFHTVYTSTVKALG